jgi:hypothetical protein
MGVVTGNANVNGGFNQVVSTGLVQSQTLPASITLSTQYTNGTGAGQIDLLYAKRLSLVASTPQTIDLNALTTIDGATSAYVRVREFWLRVVTTTVDFNVTLGNAAANAWAPIWGATGTAIVMAGSIYVLTDPTTVGSGKGYIVGGSSKNLKLDPGSNNVTVDLIIAGCSAHS